LGAGKFYWGIPLGYKPVIRDGILKNKQQCSFINVISLSNEQFAPLTKLFTSISVRF
jgi:hypothetical protein